MFSNKIDFASRVNSNLNLWFRVFLLSLLIFSLESILQLTFSQNQFYQNQFSSQHNQTHSLRGKTTIEKRVRMKNLSHQQRALWLVHKALHRYVPYSPSHVPSRTWFPNPPELTNFLTMINNKNPKHGLKSFFNSTKHTLIKFRQIDSATNFSKQMSGIWLQNPCHVRIKTP